MKLHHGGSFSRQPVPHPETCIMHRGVLARASARFAVLVTLGCIVSTFAGIACRGDGKTAVQPTVAINASTLLQQLIDGINTGDEAAAMAAFGEDAVSEGGPACAASPCTGKPAIEGDIAIYIHENVRFSACSTEDAGNPATVRCEVSTNGTREAGIDRFIASLIVTMQGGKLSTFRWGALDISDQQTAMYWATNGAALYQQFLDGLTGGDVPAVIALFADDAVLKDARDCSPATACAGNEAIRREIERRMADKVSFSSTEARLFAPFGSVTTVTDNLEMRPNSGAGQPTTVSVTLEIVGGKIVSARFADGQD